MDRFSFVMVLLSIIVGLGVTELLTNFARQIQNRATIKFYWIHTILALLVYVALLQQWWEIWGVRDVPTWTFPGLLMMLAGPTGLFLIANLLFPEPVRDTNFRDYYFDRLKPVLWLAVVSVFQTFSCRESHI